LPRFDVLAALYRQARWRDDVRAFSRMLLVSNGNATAVVDRLEKDGLGAPHAIRSATGARCHRGADRQRGWRNSKGWQVDHERGGGSRACSPACLRPIWIRFDRDFEKDPGRTAHETRGSRTTRPCISCGEVSEDRVAVLRLNRPERKNPLTFESYAEIARYVPRSGPMRKMSMWWCWRRMAAISARAAMCMTSSGRWLGWR
jgi:hypothetical protein